MTAELSCGSSRLASGETAQYNLLITTDNPIQSSIIEIVPSAEAYPNALISIDTESIVCNKGNISSAYIAGSRILEISVFDINDTELNLSFNASSNGFSDTCTTTAMVSAVQAGMVYDAYSQVSVTASGFIPSILSIIGIAAAIAATAASVVFYRIFLHSR